MLANSSTLFLIWNCKSQSTAKVCPSGVVEPMTSVAVNVLFPFRTSPHGREPRTR
ncbi:hypothetical protein FTUN_2329 [Frigoriglobus tundricola]|uniref:Uncharacterized protein n=1 Tax=Frigoriglobus tundricola TaxID=2774151 RepID=A0A6M5YN92_9BACT|nr:hypothetical protein FTUN_2329 [Frigoriglobus tundricola]